MNLLKQIQGINREAKRANGNRRKKLYARKTMMILDAKDKMRHTFSQDEKGNTIWFDDYNIGFHFGF